MTPTLQGGGLPAKYKFAQVHFHWGSKDEQGSEHQVDGKSFPVEMHLVHYKASLPNISMALEQGDPDNLAVIGIFFKVSDNANPGLAKLLPRIAEVKDAKAHIEDAPTFPLNSLLDMVDLNSFYRYEGSLTTPTCNEIVQWTVLKNPISISKEQLNSLRSLQAKHSKPLVDNYRPLQELGGRTVYSTTSTDTSGAGCVVMSSVLGLVILAFCSLPCM